MDDLEILGDILSERRVALGLTQQDLSDAALIQRTYISDIERGRRNVTVYVLARMAAALDITLGQLFRQAECRLVKQQQEEAKRSTRKRKS